MGKYKGGNGGVIVNMSSVAGLEGIPIAPIYGGTQYAIVGFTQSLKVKKQKKFCFEWQYTKNENLKYMKILCALFCFYVSYSIQSYFKNI